MHDWEQRIHQLLRDWQALRQGLECLPQDQRGDPFFHAQLDAIEASIIALPVIVHAIALRAASPTQRRPC
jgi:hypothetical protein